MVTRRPQDVFNIRALIHKRSNSMTEIKKYIKTTPDMFKDLEFKIELPTFQCSCGEEILLTPENIEQSLQDSTKES